MMISRFNRRPLAAALSLALVTALPACASNPASTSANQQSASSMSAQSANPFFAKSTLELQYPQFDKIKDSDFGPAFDRGMAEQLKEVEAIISNPAA